MWVAFGSTHTWVGFEAVAKSSFLRKKGLLELLSQGPPWLLCKAGGFLLPLCQNGQDPLSDGRLGGTFRRTHVLLFWISTLFPFLLPFLKLIKRGNFQANYGRYFSPTHLKTAFQAN